MKSDKRASWTNTSWGLAAVLIGFAAWIRFTIWLLPDIDGFVGAAFVAMEVFAKTAFCILGLFMAAGAWVDAKPPTAMKRLFILIAAAVALAILFLPT
ncbi:hypothetical protein ACFCW2_00055 [Qipengyuania sp. DSG2-2]|uniref:hypothetical protein n=1 Tax=Qipengyuania sp. DGS2-2 TaxID=3349631 RepID=UPI0036D35D35